MVLALVGVGVAAGAGAGCSSESSSSDPARALAERVQDVLASDAGQGIVDRIGQFDVEVTREELAEQLALCPRVTDPEPGDQATCLLTVGSRTFEIDVEFEDDGSIQVVEAEVAP